MDSGNSGSLQSSSGGDDEFDSRAGGGGGGGADSSPLSALLRPSPSPAAAAFSLHGSYFGGLQEFTSAPPPPQQQQQAGAWSGSFAGASGLPSSSSPRVAHADAGARPQGADASVAAAQAGQAGGVGAPAPAQQPPRGSRKRTRASRRAPTTVLTTDTSNFRAMVQEFTGIPSPPFGAGVGVGGLGGPTASLRTRFDHIFPPPSSLRSGGGTGADAAASLPPYLLRPFPHKLPSSAPSAFPPFTSSSTPSSSTVGTTNANAATGAGTAAAASSSNPAAPTAAGDAFQQLTSSALLRLQQDASSYLSFQNLLDSQPSSQSIFGSAGGFAQPSSRLHDPTPSPSDFLAGGVGPSSLGLGHHGGLLGSEGLHLHHSRSDVHGHGHGHGGDELSGVVAAGGSCKLNYSSHAGAAGSSSSAAASGEKPPDGAGPGRPGRGGDAGLDPWICTSE